MTMDVVKAGWLQRRTTILKNWKREWFVLTSDARLRRMSSPVKQYDKAEDVFQLNRSREIRVGANQVRYTTEPPSGSTREQLMELVPSDGDIWTLCAESTDDLLAWQTSFEDIRQLYIERMQQQHAQRTNTQIPSDRYSFTCYQDINGGDYPYQIFRASDGSSHTVVFVDRDSRYDRYDCGGDVSTGALAGLALGTLFLWPLFLFPIIWF